MLMTLKNSYEIVHISAWIDLLVKACLPMLGRGAGSKAIEFFLFSRFHEKL